MSTRTPRFAGFPTGALAVTPVPNLFFSELLPRIDTMVELQVTLQVFRLLAQKRGSPRYLTAAELAADTAVAAGLRLVGSADALAEGLRRAVERGTLLAMSLERSGAGDGSSRRQEIYFVNGPQGRKAVEDLLAGRLDLGQEIAEVPAVGPAPDRPGIFTLYEQNIGLLTPLLAEELGEAERLYPTEWVEAAFRQAVIYNRRNWKYVRRVLERWAIEGRQDEDTGRRSGRPEPPATYRSARSERPGYGQ